MPRILGAESRLLDLGVVCLVCLRAEPGYCSIYGQDLETPHMQIVDKIRSCSALQLDRALLNQLPDKICHGCRNELSITYRFQQKCIEAQKVFQSAVTAALLLDVEKQQLEQQQHLKLPSSLRIKRLEAEPVSSKGKYYNDANTLTLIQPEDVATALVLQDVAAVSAAAKDKIISLDVDWSTEDSQEQLNCRLEQDNEREQQLEQERRVDLKQELEQELDQELEQEIEQELDHELEQELEQELEHEIEHEIEQEIEQELELEQEQEDEDYHLPDERQEDTLVTSCIAANNNNSNHNRTINIISSVPLRHRRVTEPKICDICGNTYKYQHALNAHMRRHNNERPYPCEVCQKAFISNVELRRHMRVHTGQKPYGCLYCDRRFSDFGSSKKHERIHTGERPYICEVCNKGFAYAHVLSVHKRTHTGKKQFQCTQCDKGFTKKCYLATHLETHRTSPPANVTEAASPTQLRLPTRKQQQHQRQRQQQQLRYDDNDDVAEVDEDYDDDTVSVGMSIGAIGHMAGDQAKVLEECIVTNDFMFNDEHAEESEHEMDDYHDTELDESEFQSVQHVKEAYELVGDLLDADDLVNDTKYLME